MLNRVSRERKHVQFSFSEQDMESNNSSCAMERYGNNDDIPEQQMVYNQNNTRTT